MDEVFGAANIFNEIVWKRTSAHVATRRHSTIFTTHYSLMQKATAIAFNQLSVPLDSNYVARYYTYREADWSTICNH